MLTIEKNIPIPAIKANLSGIQPGDRSFRYPWKHMHPGDSFLLPFESREDAKRKVMTLSGTINGRMRRSGHRYTQRLVPEGVRVWRIS